MNRITNIPLTLESLVDKLIILRDLYQESSAKLQDELLNEQADRLTKEKNMFLNDFSAIRNFEMDNYYDINEKRIKTEKEIQNIRFDQLMIEGDDEQILNFWIDMERELVDHYHDLFRISYDDDFTRMILKNQLVETKQSVKELIGITKIYKTERS